MVKQNKNKTGAYVMAGVGFAMVVFNALNYLLDWDKESTPLMIIGIALTVTGMNMVRSSKLAEGVT